MRKALWIMATTLATRPAKPGKVLRSGRSLAGRLPLLENGDRLTLGDFMRRYEAMPEVNKAQLIEGIVHMPPPVRADAHSEPDGLIQLWLGLHSIYYPGLKVYPNTTLILDADNAVQPDAVLCSSPVQGGRVWLDEKGYLHGAPDLVCEVAASSASIDLHAKFQVYRRNGVAEYLVWLTGEKVLRWFKLVEAEFVEQKPKRGVLVSTIFAGLVLDLKALLRGDKVKLAAALSPPGPHKAS